MLGEFFEFLRKTNALALAVGVIIAVAIGKVVASVVGDLLMPIVGLFVGGGDWRAWLVPLKTAPDEDPRRPGGRQLSGGRGGLRDHRVLRLLDREGSVEGEAGASRSSDENLRGLRRERVGQGHAV